MNEAEKYRPYYTYNDYLEWEGRWELIDGLPYAMSPSPNAKHQQVISRLHYLFQSVILNTGCNQCSVLDFFDWKIDEATVLQPDLLIVCKPISELNYLDFSPDLIVEVLSPSTALKDRREKFKIYQEQAVKYYVIIDPAFNKIEIFSFINGAYEAVAINPSAFTFELAGCIAAIDFAQTFPG